MTLEQCKQRILEIVAVSHDPEHAHRLEDELYESVLAAIADESTDNPAGLAAIALTARQILFERWYA